MAGSLRKREALIEAEKQSGALGVLKVGETVEEEEGMGDWGVWFLLEM